MKSILGKVVLVLLVVMGMGLGEIALNGATNPVPDDKTSSAEEMGHSPELQRRENDLMKYIKKLRAKSLKRETQITTK